MNLKKSLKYIAAPSSSSDFPVKLIFWGISVYFGKSIPLSL